MAEDLKHALQIARNAAMNWYYKEHDHKHIVEYRTGDMPDAIVLALARAGLLVTPAMERATGACERLAMDYEGRASMVAATDLCISAGKQSLAERAAREKPEPRWRAEERSAGLGWVVTESGDFAPQSQVAGVTFTKVTLDRINHLTESQARAVAEALNREGGDRG